MCVFNRVENLASPEWYNLTRVVFVMSRTLVEHENQKLVTVIDPISVIIIVTIALLFSHATDIDILASDISLVSYSFQRTILLARRAVNQ